MSSSIRRVAKPVKEIQPVAAKQFGTSREVQSCMVCSDPNPVKRGMCQACYKMAHRMVMMAETTWLELSLSGCCTCDATEKNHVRKSMILERISEYRRNGRS